MNKEFQHPASYSDRAQINPPNNKPMQAAILWGLGAAGLVFLWLFLTTNYLYGGNWTSVYYTGEKWTTPHQLDKEHIYRFPGTEGYDGEQYHVVAHDPFAHTDMWKTVDMPRYRFRRILVPGLAALLSFGQENWVDPAYIFVFLLFVFLGVFWSSEWAQAQGYNAAWGLLFMLVPATLACVFFMVVDVATAALTVGFALYAASKRREDAIKLYLVLLAAGLSRETGMIIPLGYCCWLAWNKEWKRALVFGTTVIPTLLWFLWVNSRFPGGGFDYVASYIPFIGIYRGFVYHYVYQQHFLLYLDYLALVAMIGIILLAGYFALRYEKWNELIFVMLGFVALSAVISHETVWAETNAYGRHFAPLFITLGMTAVLRRKLWWALAPILLIDLRIFAVYANTTGKILSAVMHRHI